MPILTVDGLSYTYGGAKEQALRDISLAVEVGEWVVLQGITGSGKSTLLKTITGACPEFYGGTIVGTVAVTGRPVHQMSTAERLQTIGFVGQDPEAQSVYAAADREVAFALENLGTSEADMSWRVAEALELVGLSGSAHRLTSELSGGERQRLALAAALVHQPRILLLDEPTSQLDPLAAQDLLDHLRRLQHDFGMTIMLSEHRLDAVYSLADRVVYLDGGQVQFSGSAREAARWTRKHRLSQAPSLVRLFPNSDAPILSVREGRGRLETETSEMLPFGAREESDSNSTAELQIASSDEHPVEPASMSDRSPFLSVQKATVIYPGAATSALRSCSLTVPRGVITAVIGPNGSGKSTLLRLLAGLVKPGRGKVVVHSRDARVGYLPQKPSDLFSQLTVKEELRLGLKLQHRPETEIESRMQGVVQNLGMEDLLRRVPRDLSGGEQMRVAIASILMDDPTLLLLDEPTRGLDAKQKGRVGELLRSLTRQDVTIVLVSHDMELVADVAENVVFLFDGTSTLEGTARQVFAKALYFSPPVARVFRGFDDTVLSLSDAIRKGWAK
ncbi:ABC transporter ATP-binding protein [Alicyclobacillus mengziensis]|uniref:ABC transporter ATP-binding protein n=1 Tax=Alicyclobacillus mengziensis TaxID=2931921 RepID=A0A9X7Z6T9_9BACL|nr:ATP-binding cassette domain-containing protein [Alicyclobacillus mengziensis]QSO48319.1 ABC transporter ATP-binding protein [Alicyclobacillus mengziensis]